MLAMAPQVVTPPADADKPTPLDRWDTPDTWIDLFSELQAGNVEALARLYDAASGRLYGLALWRTGRREDAEEVVQEVFVRLAELRRRLGRVRDPRWWLLALTHRLAVDLMRRQKIRKVEPLEASTHLAEAPTDPARKVDAERAWTLLGRLPDKQREVIFLHHEGGMSHAEIGRLLGIPQFTAASRYRLGVKAIRRLLEERS